EFRRVLFRSNVFFHGFHSPLRIDFYISFAVFFLRRLLLRNTPNNRTKTVAAMVMIRNISDFPVNTVLYTAAPSAPPVSGPTKGTTAYLKLEMPFPGIGRKKCASRGPKSRAGLIL